ncbi:MAG: aminoacyl-tRNA hydrolase [Patescibacteria group bacterium]|nr:aminoacyl-tRNA hydrolase [Patescibacteria group bacterium]
MKIIVGLGNPGKEYEGTRHNAGFMFVDALSECEEIKPVDSKLSFNLDKKFQAEIASTNAKSEKIILAKPQTFMNLSGKAVSKILAFYKASPEDLIVISDDIDLPIGTIRIRKEGSGGGQKGLENIISELKTDNFTRIRIGITETGEKANRADTVDYVLGKIGEREKPILDKAILEGINYLLEFLGTEKEVPCHTIEVVGKEEGPSRV